MTPPPTPLPDPAPPTPVVGREPGDELGAEREPLEGHRQSVDVHVLQLELVDPAVHDAELEGLFHREQVGSAVGGQAACDCLVHRDVFGDEHRGELGGDLLGLADTARASARAEARRAWTDRRQAAGDRPAGGASGAGLRARWSGRARSALVGFASAWNPPGFASRLAGPRHPWSRREPPGPGDPLGLGGWWWWRGPAGGWPQEKSATSRRVPSRNSRGISEEPGTAGTAPGVGAVPGAVPVGGVLGPNGLGLIGGGGGMAGFGRAGTRAGAGRGGGDSYLVPSSRSFR